MKKNRPEQLQLILHSTVSRDRASPTDIASAFDPARLTQARQLAGLTKKELAEAVGVTPAAIGQYETGSSGVRPLQITRLADVLGVPPNFFLAGRAHGKLDAAMAHFRSLRSMRSYQRAKAISFVEQVWELAHSLEKYVQLPYVDVPGFAGGELESGTLLPADPTEAAKALRRHWNLGVGPIPHLVRNLESRGIICVITPRDEDMTTVDAFSTSRLQRPLIVLTANRADDVLRHRFTAAHELGHLVLHGDVASGDIQQEREADNFAAEFLTPRDAIAQELPTRIEFTRLLHLQEVWGVSVKSLVYRCRELGLISESAATRAYQRLNSLRGQPGFREESVSQYLGERPAMLRMAFELATRHGMSINDLASDLAWSESRVRELLGLSDQVPKLRLIVNNDHTEGTEDRDQNFA